MQKTKLITVLVSLQKEEWATLRRHVLQYTHAESDVFLVFDYFSERRNKLNIIDDVEIIVKKHFPSMTPKVFLNHMSTLYQWLEEWMVLEEVKIGKFDFDLILLKALNRRGLYNLADKVDVKIQKDLLANQLLDIENSKAKSLSLHHQYYSNNPIKYEKGPIMLKELVDNFAILTKEQFLLYKAELQNWGRIKNYDYKSEITLIDNITSQIEPSELSNTFEDLNILLEKNDTVLFTKLCTDLLSGKLENHSTTQTIVNIYLIQIANKFWQKGVQIQDLKATLANLYSYGLNNGIFSEHGKLLPLTFRNIINTLAGIQSFEFIDDFINNHIHLVNKEHQESTKNICLATNCLFHEHYQKIPIFIRGVDFKNVGEKILALSLNVMSSFMEQDTEYDLYINNRDNFEKLLIRNKSKISEKQFSGYINLIDFMKKVYKSNKEIELTDYSYLMFRTWCEKVLIKKKATARK